MSQPVPKSKTQPPRRRFLKISFVVPRDWGRDLERLKREKKCVTTSELVGGYRWAWLEKCCPL